MIIKLKNELVQFIKSGRANMFLLFLVSSFIILIVTKLSKEYTKTIVFQVQKVNVPEDKIILKDTTQKFEVTLKTHGFRWLKYYFSKPKFTIDFSKEVYTNKNTFYFNKSIAYINKKKAFEKQTEILDITPDTLAFKYDTHLVKRVPVIINANINYTPGYDSYAGLVAQPDTITIIGPQEKVKQIKGIPTALLDVKDVKTPIKEQLKLELPEDIIDLKFSSKTVILSAHVEKFTEGNLKIPVHITNLPKSTVIKYFPKHVTIAYYTSLKDFNAIQAEDFEIQCDFQSKDKTQTFLIPELVKKPEKVKHIKLRQQHIEFIIVE